MSTILVNKEWKDYEAGTKVTVDNVEYEIGVSAFATLDAAIAAAGDKQATYEISDADLKTSSDYTHTIDNGSTALVKGIAAGAPAPTDVDIIKVAGGSSLQVSGTLDVTGNNIVVAGTEDQIAVDGGKIYANSLDNSGEVTFSGESTAIINEVTGEGTIYVADGATLTDSEIATQIIANGAITLKGDNVFQKLAFAQWNNPNNSITVEEGGSLTFTGYPQNARLGLGYCTFNVTGELTDALAVTDLTGLKKTFDAQAGASLTGEATINFTDAYVSFASASNYTSSAKSSFGDYKMTFTNSIVDFGKGKFMIQTSSSDVNFEITFDKSQVFITGGRLELLEKRATVTVSNGSKMLLTKEWRNNATFNLTSGSTFDFTGAHSNGALSNYSNGDNYGIINIDGATLNMSNANGNLHKYGNQLGGQINLTNGGRLVANSTVAFFNVAEINVDATSLIQLDSYLNTATTTVDGVETTYTGVINVDLTGYAGGKLSKIIDITGDAHTWAEGDIVLKNAGDAPTKLFYGADGDVFLDSSDKSNLLINGTWSSYANGDSIEGHEGYFFGINAFADVESALAAKMENTTTFTFLGGDGSTYVSPVEDIDVVVAGNYRYSAGDANNPAGIPSNVTVIEGGSIAGWINVGYDVGDSGGNHNKSFTMGEGKVVINGGSARNISLGGQVGSYLNAAVPREQVTTSSDVGEAELEVTDGLVTGNVFGGGVVVGSSRQTGGYGRAPSVGVNKSTITIADGEFRYSVYAGGYVYVDTYTPADRSDDTLTATVNEASISISGGEFGTIYNTYDSEAYVNGIFGGGAVSASAPAEHFNPNLTSNNKTFDSTGANAKVDSSTITITGGTFGVKDAAATYDVYGGGWIATDGTFDYDTYYKGKGFAEDYLDWTLKNDTMTASSVVGDVTITISDATIYGSVYAGGRNDYAGANFKNTVANATITIDAGAVIDRDVVGTGLNGAEVTGDSTLIWNGGTIGGTISDFDNVTIGAEVNDAVALAGEITSLTNNSDNLVLESSSAVEVETFSNTGTITINVAEDADEDILIKVIDSVNDDAEYGNITVTGKEGFDAYVINGDLYVSSYDPADVDTSVLHVEAAVDGYYDYGEKINDGLYFGINVFSTLTDAVYQAANNAPGTDTRIILYSEEVYLDYGYEGADIQGNLTIESAYAEEGYPILIYGSGSYNSFNMPEGSTLRLGEGIIWLEPYIVDPGNPDYNYHTFQIDGVVGYEGRPGQIGVAYNTTILTPTGKIFMLEDGLESVIVLVNGDLVVEGAITDLTDPDLSIQDYSIVGGSIMVAGDMGDSTMTLTNAVAMTMSLVVRDAFGGSNGGTGDSEEGTGDSEEVAAGSFQLNLDSSGLVIVGSNNGYYGLNVDSEDADVEINVANKSQLMSFYTVTTAKTDITVNNSLFSGRYMENVGAVTLEAGAEFIISNELDNCGKITVNDSKVDVGGVGNFGGVITVDNSDVIISEFNNTKKGGSQFNISDSTVNIEWLDNTDESCLVSLSGDCELTLGVVAGSRLVARDGASLSGTITLVNSFTRDDSGLGLIVAEGDITVDSTLLGDDIKLVMDDDTSTLNIVVDTTETPLPTGNELMEVLSHVELGADNDIVITVDGKEHKVSDEGAVIIGDNGYELVHNDDGTLNMRFLMEMSDFTNATLTGFGVTQAEDGYYFVLGGTYDAGDDTDAIMTLVVTGPENFLGVPVYDVITGTSLEDLNAQLKENSFIADGANSLSTDDLTFTITLNGFFDDDIDLVDATVKIVDKTAPIMDDVAVTAVANYDTVFVTWNEGTDNVGITNYTVTIFDANDKEVATTDEFEVNADGKLQAVITGLAEGTYTASVTAEDAAELSDTATSSAFDVTATYSNPTKKPFIVGSLGGDAADDVLVVTKSPDSYGGTDEDGEAVGVPHAALFGITTADGKGTVDKSPLWDANAWHVMGTADIDGNGTDDVILGNVTDSTEELAAYRLGTLEGDSKLVSLRKLDTTEWSAIAIGDLDGDGRDELLSWQAATDTTGSIRSERKVMVSSFHDNGGHDRDTVLSSTVSGDWSIVAVGDVANPNKDCEHVVLHNATTGTVAYWDYNVFGTLTQFTLGTIDDSEKWTCLDSGDFNGDGKDDLLWLDDDNNLVWSDSNDRCETHTLGALNENDLNGYVFVSTGDFDNDGTAELLWASDDTNKDTLAWSEVNSYNTLNQYLA